MESMRGSTFRGTEALPASVTTVRVPLQALAGTTQVTAVSVQEVTSAAVPLTSTLSWKVRGVPKSLPLTVTVSPAYASGGSSEVMEGGLPTRAMLAE